MRGVSLYLTIMIMTIFLGIGLGLLTLFLSQIKMIKGMGDSVVAFFAADTGIERILVTRTSPSDISTTFLPIGASYEVKVTPGGSCGASNYCIKSTGKYKNIKRAIEIRY